MKGPGSPTPAFPSPDSWITKRQHPGKREEEEEIEAEERGDIGEGETWSPYKRQHPGRRANQDSWFLDAPQVKRQHPGRRSFPWMESDLTKRQHPGRRFIDPKLQRSWEQKEEGEGVPMPEKRQHPGKRALDHPCGPQGTCGQTGLLQLLGELSRGQETLEKQSPQLEDWVREPLLED
ncbi:Pro-thyrotropin-releasing hormone [Lemmus lemmus]